MRKVFALLAIALLVLVAACMAPEEEEAAPVVAPPEVVPEPTPITPEEIAQLDLVTDAVCANGMISAVITNNGDEDWTVATDVKVILNAGQDKEPGCDKEVLAPGESMVCDTIDFPIVLKPGKKNILVISGDGSTETTPVICPVAATEE